jgi:CBS domain-containing protein
MDAASLAIQDAEVAADLMLPTPKTLPGDATVAHVRTQLEDPRVQMVLLADNGTFRGAVTSIPMTAEADESALDYAESDAETITPDASAIAAFNQAAASPHRRVIVLDGDHLLGLLCLNATRSGFCRTTGTSPP